MEYFDCISIFSIAFVASLGHCVGMCGGIVIAYTRTKIHNPHAFARNAFSHLLYVCGRVCMYMVLGAIFGSFGAIFTQDMHIKAIMGVCVSVLLLIFGFAYLLFPNLLRIFEPSILPTASQHTGESTRHQSLSKRVFEKVFELFTYLLHSRSMASFFLLGMLNGILPCGIVYYFLISAVASGSAMGGIMIMGTFGVASALVMYAFALFASSLMRVLKPAFFNTLAGLCMVGYGGWGVFSNLALL
ncbi:sulfite exporter TauE/SafE family protein [uncultured Helicobacter sp.]|uniref:sulfite exporter TauE/SafE family protein n=1 Tax=uncultured Helicobacter sp. TaxID=175537 RepID=UPI00374F1072